MWRVILVVVIGGIAMVAYGVREYLLSKDSSAEPVAIAIEDLERGVPDNPHCRLGPHFAVLDNVVYSEVKRSGSSSVEHAYYPVVSVATLKDTVARLGLRKDDPAAGLALIQGLPVKIIVKTHRWKTVAEIRAEADRPESDFRNELVGMVVNRIDSVGSKEADLLKKATPNFDPATTIIIEEGRKPKSVALTLGLIIGGVVLVIGSFAVLLISRLRRPSPEPD
ncbi:MAG: hypothetical protein U0793_27790 [Gemmataceae bacterium]